MRSLPRPLIIAIIVIIVITAGSLYLIRSCMFGGGKGFGGAPKGMREQYANAPALYLEKEGKGVILTIVSHLKIHSYSRQGNMVRKSASTTYYLQTNDAATAAMLDEVKLKSHTDIKSYPVEVMGAAGTNAWIFMGEPMAFDAFTLEKKADIKILEEKNRNLAGKFPAERRFYQFDPSGEKLFFTAMDGSKWELNTQTLQATVSGYDEDNNPFQQQIDGILEAEKKNRAGQDSLYQQKSRRPAQQYAAKQISAAEYKQLSREYREGREVLNKERDRLRLVRRELESKERSSRERLRNLKDLKAGHTGYSDARINQDTVNGNWYGLYSTAEFRKLNDNLQYHSEHDGAARRELYIGSYAENPPGTWKLDKTTARLQGTGDIYLHGGFLLDKNSALPIHPGGAGSFLIIHKESVARDAAILVSRVDHNGKKMWTFNTGLSEWADWIFSGKQLVILGTNNKELSSGQVNLLWIIDLPGGSASGYDYYEDKLIRGK